MGQRRKTSIVAQIHLRYEFAHRSERANNPPASPADVRPSALAACFPVSRRNEPSGTILRGVSPIQSKPFHIQGNTSRPEYQCRVLLKAVATPFFGGEPYEKRPSFRPISVVIALWISALHIGARAIDGKRAGMLAFFASRSDAVRAFHVGVCAAHFAFYIRSALVAGT